MKVGIIGAGRIGANHARILSALPGVSALIIADVASDRAEQLAASLPNSEPADVEVVFELSEAIVIASSTDTHAALLMKRRQAGLPTFCEKPIALDLESTREAVVAVESSGITVQMGFQRRYDPGIRAIRRQLDAGELGTVYLVRSQTHDPAPPPIDYIRGSGGVFKDCLIHDIDAVRFVTGQDILAVTAFGSEVGHPDIAAVGDFGTATAILQLSGGTIGQISGLRHRSDRIRRSPRGVRVTTRPRSRLERADADRVHRSRGATPGGPDRHVLGSLRFRLPCGTRGLPPSRQRRGGTRLWTAGRSGESAGSHCLRSVGDGGAHRSPGRDRLTNGRSLAPMTSTGTDLLGAGRWRPDLLGSGRITRMGPPDGP